MVYLSNFDEHVKGIEAGEELATIGNSSWYKLAGVEYKIDYDDEHNAVMFMQVGTKHEWAPDAKLKCSSCLYQVDRPRLCRDCTLYENHHDTSGNRIHVISHDSVCDCCKEAANRIY